MSISLRTVVLAALTLLVPCLATAEVVTLKNGYQVSGKVGRISELVQNPLEVAGGGGGADLIVIVDDDLRRIFVPYLFTQSAAGQPEAVARQTEIVVPQREAKIGPRISAVGVPLKVEPFDEWGRRIFSMATANGPIHVVQGITKVTPTFTVLKSLQAEDSYIWETKIATSSIPRETLSKILRKQAGDDYDKRLEIVRLYIQANRYNDARAEAEGLVKEFPKITDANSKLMQMLRQESAIRLVDEIELRRDAGQAALVAAMAQDFPTEGVAGETLLRVREILTQYAEMQQQGQQVLSLLEEHLEALPDDKQKAELKPIQAEITAELNIHNLNRFADYLRLADAEELKADQKLSLAVSGWLLGNGEATENLSVAISLFEVRELIGQYIRSTHDGERAEILKKLEGLEGSSPTYVSRLLAHMKPAVPTEANPEAPPGFFELKTPGLAGDADITYYVQLPPEYNPYRRYPTIVTLNGGFSNPQAQINWWAGDYDPKRKMRMGQATRRGHIVIAPVWTKQHQTAYEFSAREHAAVLFSLRDALQRFSIDTDRVFLSGHSMGGDAAWDISLSHPDLWAGSIVVGGNADKYIKFYHENGKHVPLYYVAGELDGDRFAECGVVLDQYLTGTNYDAVVVQYQGRGHEHFYEEIQDMFAWMKLHQRPSLTKEFVCSAMRPWDNFFWWVEVQDYPQPLMVLPAMWPPKRGNTAEVKGSIPSSSYLRVSSSAPRATIWLTPEMVDFEKRFRINYNNKDYNVSVQPSVAVMLEDVRTRGDRQHPFWQKVDVGAR